MKQGKEGYVLLAILVVMLSALSIALVSRHQIHLNAVDGSSPERDAVSRKALAAAKEALLAYAQNNFGSPGELPCPAQPSLDEEGAMTIKGEVDASCTLDNAAQVKKIGRFPWKTLGINVPLDADGECIWYVVYAPIRKANNLDRSSTSEIKINPASLTSTAGLALDDDSRALALIVAPGRPLDNQTRTSISDSPCHLGNVESYLEGEKTRNLNSDMVDSPRLGNDIVVPIRAAEIRHAAFPTVLRSLSSNEIKDYIQQKAPVLLTELRADEQRRMEFDTLVYKLAGGTDTLEYPAPPAQSPAPAISSVCPTNSEASNSITWLCRNDWLKYIRYEKGSNTEPPTISIESSSPQTKCSISLDKWILKCS